MSGKYYPKQTGTGLLKRNKGSIRYKALQEIREGCDKTLSWLVLNLYMHLITQYQNLNKNRQNHKQK